MMDIEKNIVNLRRFLEIQTIKTYKKMRKHIVAGNWKMNTTVAEGV